MDARTKASIRRSLRRLIRYRKGLSWHGPKPWYYIQEQQYLLRLRERSRRGHSEEPTQHPSKRRSDARR